MAPTLFTSVLVSVLHCTVIDLYGKSVVILQPQTMVSAAAQCPALWMALATLQPCRVNCFPHIQCVHGPLRLTGQLHFSHKKKNIQAHREAWNSAVRHAGIPKFGLISPHHGVQ